jgi:hypothetical protein
MLWHDDQAWEALEHVVRFREHRPTDVDAMLLHASVLGYQGDLSGHARLYELSRDVVRPLVRDGLPEAIAIDGQALGHLGRWDSALTAARRLLREPDDSGHWRHSAWHVVKAALDGSLDDPERESIVERAIALYGQNEALSEELAVARAIQGDVDGTIAAFRTTPERLHEASPRVRAVVGVAMLTAGRGAEAYALLEPMADEFDGVAVSILVDAAIAAGDIDGALAAYGRLAAPGDAQDRIAELGIRLLESAEAAARAEDLAVFANERSGIQAWLLPRSEAIPPARDSGWEGPHRRTSQVLDDVPFGPVH